MSFFEMGGYAAYVWPAFGIGAIVLIALVIFSFLRLKKREALVRQLEAEQGIKRRRNGNVKEGK